MTRWNTQAEGKTIIVTLLTQGNWNCFNKFESDVALYLKKTNLSDVYTLIIYSSSFKLITRENIHSTKDHNIILILFK